MGDYAKSTLSEGENVIKNAKFHWTKYFWPCCFLLASFYCLYCIIIFVDEEDKFLFWGGIIFLVITYLFYRILQLMADEVTLTDQRLVAKRGLFSRNTLDLQLSEVESVSIDLPFFTHYLFGTGTIIIAGTGGSRIAVPKIANILEFRKIAQETLNEKRAHANVTSDKKEQQNNVKYESSEKIDLLLKLKRLLDGGVITMEEFQRERDKIMNSI